MSHRSGGRQREAGEAPTLASVSLVGSGSTLLGEDGDVLRTESDDNLDMEA